VPQEGLAEKKPGELLATSNSALAHFSLLIAVSNTNRISGHARSQSYSYEQNQSAWLIFC
jgi:hypothetical protein